MNTTKCAVLFGTQNTEILRILNLHIFYFMALNIHVLV